MIVAFVVVAVMAVVIVMVLVPVFTVLAALFVRLLLEFFLLVAILLVALLQREVFEADALERQRALVDADGFGGFRLRFVLADQRDVLACGLRRDELAAGCIPCRTLGFVLLDVIDRARAAEDGERKGSRA